MPLCCPLQRGVRRRSKTLIRVGQATLRRELRLAVPMTLMAQLGTAPLP
jgi:hypothetical protein